MQMPQDPPSLRTDTRSLSEVSGSVLEDDMSHHLDYHFRPLAYRRHHRRRQRYPRPHTEFLDDLLPEEMPSESAEIGNAHEGGTGPELGIGAASVAVATDDPVVAAAEASPEEPSEAPLVVTIDPTATVLGPDGPGDGAAAYNTNTDPDPMPEPDADPVPQVVVAATGDTIQDAQNAAADVLDDLQTARRPNFPHTGPAFNPLHAYYSVPNRRHTSFALPPAMRARPVVAAPTPGPVYPVAHVFRLRTQVVGKGMGGAHEPLTEMTLLDGMTGMPVLTCSRQSMSRLLGVVKDPATNVPALFINLCMMSSTHAFLLATNAAAAPVFTAGVWLPGLSTKSSRIQADTNRVGEKGHVTVVECVAGDVWDCGHSVVRFKEEAQTDMMPNGEQTEEIMRRRKRRWRWARRVMRVVSSRDGKTEWVIGPAGETLATFVGKVKKSKRTNGIGYSSSRGIPNQTVKWSLSVAPGIDVGVVLASLFCQTCALSLVSNGNAGVSMDAATNVNTNLVV